MPHPNNRRQTITAKLVRVSKDANVTFIHLEDLTNDTGLFVRSATLEYRPQMRLTPGETVTLEARFELTRGEWQVSYPLHLLPMRIKERQQPAGSIRSVLSVPKKRVIAA